MPKIGNIELPEFPLLLAPMEDVSDPPFRTLCKEQGADVMYTEFISSEGLTRGNLRTLDRIRRTTRQLSITWRLSGFGELAAEVAP